jgi:hypothetical protein
MMELPYVIQALFFALILQFIFLKTKHMSMKRRIIIVSIFSFSYGYFTSVLFELLQL